ncbi:MAG: TraR/DksA C4-type zinc finger protein [Candidatus Delongbacteria bacterium]|nr:TraR/DksA C4-type zinc finger protein [Candidatus Delongbacteria bacterium]
MITKAQIDEIRQIILQKKAELEDQLSIYKEKMDTTSKESSGDISSYSFHMADQGTDAIEREKTFFLASREGRFLHHLSEALRRIDNGSYDGKCQICGGDINLERLKAVPHASKCIECKMKEEKNKA